MYRFARPVLITLSILLTTYPATASQWPTDDASQISVSSAFNRQQNPSAATDGAGGAIVAWEDLRDEFSWNIWAQRVGAYGETLWTTDGVVVCGDPSNQTEPQVVSDGAGGGFIVWLDSRNLSVDIYAQRVDGDGNPLWAVNGVPVTDFPDNQFDFRVVTDGAGGIIVAWVDMRSGVADVYAQRLDASGTPLWTAGGVAVCFSVTYESEVCVASDGAGGAIIGWVDTRNVEDDVYAQRLDNTGSPLWTANGVAAVDDAGDQNSPAIVSSLDNGAIIVWDGPGWINENGIYGARLLGEDGSSAWGNTTDGTPLSTSDLNAIRNPIMVSDGAYGAIIAYEINPLFETYPDVYVMRIKPQSGGIVMWDEMIADDPVDHEDMHLARIGPGESVVAWRVDRIGQNTDGISAQRVNASGNTSWVEDGQPVSQIAGNQHSPQVVSDGLGGGIVIYQDDASGPIDLNIMAHRIERWGYAGYPSPVITGIEDAPLDDGGEVILSWDASYLDIYPSSIVTEYSVWRKWLGAGAKANAVTGRGPDTMDKAQVATFEKAGWSFVGTQDAQWFDEYSFTAPTYSDSTGLGFSQTAFMVIAQTTTSTRFWSSQEAAGWSVDNLAPSAPLNLLGAKVPEGAQLVWQLPEANNLDIENYRVFGSDLPGVIPGPGTLLITTPDMDWLDMSLGSGTKYYVVTALDDGGNESSPSNEVSVSGSGTSDTPDLVTELTLRGVVPNPFNPAAEIRFAVPEGGGHVTLEVYGVDGRRVRRLLDTEVSEGRHTAVWNGTNDEGHRLSSGVYFAVLRGDETTRISKMVMVQ